MNIVNLVRIQDSFDEEQLRQMVTKSVRKHQKQYHPSFKGEIEDLVSDIMLSLLKNPDIFKTYDEDKSSLPYYVKVIVQRKLIDKERTIKSEERLNTDIDESGDLIFDLLDDRDEVQIEDIEFSKEEVDSLKRRFDKMNKHSKVVFLNYYEGVKEILSPNFKELFKKIISDSEDVKFDKSEIVPFSDIEVGKWYYLNRQGSLRFGPDKKVKCITRTKYYVVLFNPEGLDSKWVEGLSPKELKGTAWQRKIDKALGKGASTKYWNSITVLRDGNYEIKEA